MALTSKEDLIQIIILTTRFLSQVISQRVIIICVAYYICFCAGWSSLSWCITKTNWKERGQWYFVNKLSMWFGKKIKVLWTQESNYDLLVSNPDALPLSYRRLKGFKATKLGNSTFFSEQTFHFGCLILNYLHGRPEVFLWVGQSCFLFMHDLYSFDMITEYCSHFNVIKICF